MSRIWILYVLACAGFAVLGWVKVAPWMAAFVAVQAVVQLLPLMWFLRGER